MAKSASHAVSPRETNISPEGRRFLLSKKKLLYFVLNITYITFNVNV